MGRPRGAKTRLRLFNRAEKSLGEFFPRRRHRQLAVLHAFGADQAVGHGPYVAAFPLDHEDLNTMVVIQMDMHGNLLAVSPHAGRQDVRRALIMSHAAKGLKRSSAYDTLSALLSITGRLG